MGKITLSAIKADIGSVAGHTRPSERVLKKVMSYIAIQKGRLIRDYYVGYSGDDIHILMTHDQGVNDKDIHGLAWDSFMEGTIVAKEQGLYGAGQDLLADSFSGTIKGMGPGIAEMTIDERKSEPFIMLAADKTEPGAFNRAFYDMFINPDHNSGLLVTPTIKKGYKFTIMDVNHVKTDRIIELSSPEKIYEIVTLLRDNHRYVVEQIHARFSGEQVVSSSTSRLHNISGTYSGKDDPIALVRAQKNFPATEEIAMVFNRVPFVAGNTRGSHNLPFKPVKKNTPATSAFCIPQVSALGFQVKDGKLYGEDWDKNGMVIPTDLFADSYWDTIRTKADKKADMMREQGWYGAAMLPITELEYGGITKTLKELDTKFKLRP